MPIRCVACLEKSSATIGTKKLVESGKADTDPPTAAAPRELSANFYGKAALREAVTAKSLSHTCQVIVQSIHLLSLHWGG
jgi:hypothetical protein